MLVSIFCSKCAQSCPDMYRASIQFFIFYSSSNITTWLTRSPIDVHYLPRHLLVKHWSNLYYQSWRITCILIAIPKHAGNVWVCLMMLCIPICSMTLFSPQIFVPWLDKALRFCFYNYILCYEKRRERTHFRHFFCYNRMVGIMLFGRTLSRSPATCLL